MKPQDVQNYSWDADGAKTPMACKGDEELGRLPPSGLDLLQSQVPGGQVVWQGPQPWGPRMSPGQGSLQPLEKAQDLF